MPTFILNKIIRDKLVADNERLCQKAEYKELSLEQHKLELINKIIEETQEINIHDSSEKTAGEIADLFQVIKDFMTLSGITDGQVELLMCDKFNKKGGFLAGAYVTKLTLQDDDKWVKYYRERPDIFPEE